MAAQSTIAEGISSTDSIGTHSDISGHTTISGRPRMDVACVLDLQQPEHLAQRRRALEEVRQACNLVNANMHHIQVYLYKYFSLLKVKISIHIYILDYFSSLKS